MTIRPADLDADAILGVGVDRPETLFGATDQIAIVFRTLARRWHPDANKAANAAQVFAHLVALRAEADRRAAAGRWRGAGVTTFEGRDGRIFELRYARMSETTTADVYVGRVACTIAFRPGHGALADKAARRIAGLRFTDAGARDMFAPRLPAIAIRVERKDGDVLVLRKSPTELLLTDLLALSGGRIDPRHVAWIVTDLLSTASMLATLQRGLTFPVLDPDAVLIDVAGHSARLVGGWEFAEIAGDRIEALPSAVIDELPEILLRDRRASHALTLEAIRRVAARARRIARHGRPAPARPAEAVRRLARRAGPVLACRGFPRLGARPRHELRPAPLSRSEGRFRRRLWRALKEDHMGNGRWDASAFASFTTTRTAGKSASAIFTARDMPKEFDPNEFTVRESRDSAANPASTAIMLCCDVTGSMGVTAEKMIREGLDKTMREIHARKPVSDPHILVGAVGDAYCDRAPLQMTQFEADVSLADQLARIWIEGGGGGNNGESYLIAHYGAAMKTSIDCFEKRGKKGFLFTIGDEPALSTLTRDQIERVFGVHAERDLSAAECLAMAQRSYEVFHIVLTDVGVAANNLRGVLKTWEPLLGERVLKVSDIDRVPEVIVSTLQVMAGEDAHRVAASWSGDTSLVVANAIKALRAPGLPGGDITRL